MLLSQLRTACFSKSLTLIALTISTTLLVSCSMRVGKSPSESQTIEPSALAARLADTSAAKPHLLHVGFEALYSTSHIPGSLYAGPGAREVGIKKLYEAAASLPKDADIVIYCGCCPWDNCPNVRPAFEALAKDGFTNVHILKINDHFQPDWIDKGYPVEQEKS